MIKETDPEGNTRYKYVKCPACGSKKRHFENISEKAIKMGLAGQGFLIAFIYDHKIVGDPVKLQSLPLGGEATSITAATEICMDCGCVYAPMVVAGKDKKGIAQQKPKLIVPGH